MFRALIMLFCSVGALAAAALWVHSYRPLAFADLPADLQGILRQSGGSIHDPRNTSPRVGSVTDLRPSDTTLIRIAIAGGEIRLGWAHLTQIASEFRMYTVYVPIAVPFVVFCAYPVSRLLFPPLRKRYRRRCGLCVGCGYDLTGNESGVCPECGGEIMPP